VLDCPHFLPERGKGSKIAGYRGKRGARNLVDSGLGKAVGT
jgi:hypothetical protein